MSKSKRDRIAKDVGGADDGTHRLDDIDPEEVSVVNRGANKKKRFLIVKEDKPGEGKTGDDTGANNDAGGEGGEGEGGETLAGILKSQLDPYAKIVKALEDAQDGDLPEDVRNQANAVLAKLASGFGLVLVEKEAGDEGTSGEAGKGTGEGGGNETRSGVKKLDLKEGESYDAFRDKLRTALGEVRNDPAFGTMPMGGEDRYLYINDVFNDFIIVENSEDWSYWKVPFGREADGTVKLDLSKVGQVERVESYVPVAKSDSHWMTTMASMFSKLTETLTGLQAPASQQVDEDVVKSQTQNALKTIFGDAGITDPVAFFKSVKDRVEKSAGNDGIAEKVKTLQETVTKQAKQLRKFDGLLIGQSHVEEGEGDAGEGQKKVSWPQDMAADVAKGKNK